MNDNLNTAQNIITTLICGRTYERVTVAGISILVINQIRTATIWMVDQATGEEFMTDNVSVAVNALAWALA